LCADVAAQSGMKVTAVASAEEALHVLENFAVDILITDLKLMSERERILAGTFLWR
jgi:DNA-binding response OmpR family regulator